MICVIFSFTLEISYNVYTTFFNLIPLFNTNPLNLSSILYIYLFFWETLIVFNYIGHGVPFWCSFRARSKLEDPFCNLRAKAWDYCIEATELSTQFKNRKREKKKKNSDVWCDFQVFQYNIDVKLKPKLVIFGLI